MTASTNLLTPAPQPSVRRPRRRRVIGVAAAVLVLIGVRMGYTGAGFHKVVALLLTAFGIVALLRAFGVRREQWSEALKTIGHRLTDSDPNTVRSGVTEIGGFRLRQHCLGLMSIGLAGLTATAVTAGAVLWAENASVSKAQAAAVAYARATSGLMVSEASGAVLAVSSNESDSTSPPATLNLVNWRVSGGQPIVRFWGVQINPVSIVEFVAGSGVGVALTVLVMTRSREDRGNRWRWTRGVFAVMGMAVVVVLGESIMRMWGGESLWSTTGAAVAVAGVTVIWAGTFGIVWWGRKAVSSWPVLAVALLVMATTMAAGLFTTLNNRAIPWQFASQASATAGHYYYRDEFLRAAGRTANANANGSVDTGSWHVSAANAFLKARKDAREAAELVTPGRPADAASLNVLMSKSDVELRDMAAKDLMLKASVIPRPSNRWFGIAEVDRLSFAADPESPAGPVPLTTEAIRARLLPMVGDGPSVAAGSPRERRVNLLARLLSRELELAQTDVVVLIIRRANGLIQFLTVSALLTGVLLVVVRMIRAWGFEESLYMDHAKLKTLRPNPVTRVLMAVTDAGLGSPGASPPRVSEADIVIRDSADVEADQFRSEQGILKFIAWMIPAIGFLGTVFGIGNALMKADKLLEPGAEQAAALQRFFAQLSVAFDTTFVALLSAIVMMFLLHYLQRREEHLIHRATAEAMRRAR